MPDEHIGSRVRLWRRRRQLSRVVLAGQAGLSQGCLSQIEAGLRMVEKRSTLVELAGALDVSVADPLGQAIDPTDPVRARASEAVAAIRLALVELEAGETRDPSRSPRPADARPGPPVGGPGQRDRETYG